MVTNKIDHFIQKDETIYNAQLQRPKDDSRFMSIDPMAGHSPNMSPYSFANNNPIAMLDNGGDSTIFYTERGDYLYSTNDRLANAVVFVADANMIAFRAYEQSFFGGGNPKDINTAAALLRNQGSIYLIDPIKHFYELHKNDFYLNTKYVHEHGTNWIHTGNVVTPDFASTSNQGTDVHIYGGPDLHTHPNEDKGEVYNEGQPIYNDAGNRIHPEYGFGPSGEDYHEYTPNQFNVAISKNNIYFFSWQTIHKNPIVIDSHKFGTKTYKDHNTSPSKSSDDNHSTHNGGPRF